MLAVLHNSVTMSCDMNSHASHITTTFNFERLNINIIRISRLYALFCRLMDGAAYIYVLHKIDLTCMDVKQRGKIKVLLVSAERPPSKPYGTML